MTTKQKTIRHSVSVSGVGLHTGKKTNLTFLPAAENHGFKFQRIDLPGMPIIDADVDNVTETARGTTLEQNGGKICTTEHVLASLIGMNLDNVLMQVDGPEVPIMDGSSRLFMEALEKAGIQDQKADRIYFELKENLTFEDPIKKVEMLAVPQDEYRLTVMVDYNSEVLGTQHATMYHLGEFKEQISSCRTFVFLHELEGLLQHNLIKGGDLDNAIVLVEKVIPVEKLDYLAKVFNKPDVQVKGKGVLNNTTLHFYNEPARHKLLDIVGDLALTGRYIKAHILAGRPGHAGNVAFAKKIKAMIKEQEQKPAKAPEITFDLTKEPLLNVIDIQNLLPHRPPMLLIDRIMEMSKEHIVGVKNVTINEDFFRGHFPGNPVMPGVLLVEAMAQTGGVLALKNVPDPENYLTYFLKIDGVKFRQMVVPGDTVIFRLDLLTPIRRGLVHMKGIAYVKNKPVMEAELMAQITKVKNIPAKNESTVLHQS